MDIRDHDEIGVAIDSYLKAIKTGDAKHFERAFYSYSFVINAGEEDHDKSVIPIKDFMKRIQDRHESGVYVEEIPHGITISNVGKVANVRLDFELKIGDQTLYGTDYFNLVKNRGKWRISQKIYYVTHSE